MTYLPPLERTIRSALPAGLPIDENAVAERIAAAVRMLHLAALEQQVVDAQAERDAAFRAGMERVVRELLAEGRQGGGIVSTGAELAGTVRHVTPR